MLKNYFVNLTIDSVGYLYTHLHTHYEMILILSDNVQLFFENFCLDVKKGDLFIIPPYTFHKLISETPFDSAFIYFEKYSLLKKVPVLEPAFEYLSQNHIFRVHIPDNETAKVAQMFVDAYNLFYSEDEFMYDFLNSHHFGHMLHYFIKLHLAHPDNTLPHRVSNELTSSILKYINDNLCENITTEEITKKFNISKTKLYMILKESTGLSLKAFIIQLKLSYASELLSQGLSVTEVANKVGFNSYAHFIKIFKQKIGASPYKYGKGLQKFNDVFETTNPDILPINHPELMGTSVNKAMLQPLNANSISQIKKNNK